MCSYVCASVVTEITRSNWRQAPEGAAVQRIKVDFHSLRYKTPPQRLNRIKGRELEEGKIGIAVAPGLSPPGRRYGSI
jgi:hypothetical protein